MCVQKHMIVCVCVFVCVCVCVLPLSVLFAYGPLRPGKAGAPMLLPLLWQLLPWLAQPLLPSLPPLPP
jgi:hypothetical protein